MCFCVHMRVRSCVYVWVTGRSGGAGASAACAQTAECKYPQANPPAYTEVLMHAEKSNRKIDLASPRTCCEIYLIGQRTDTGPCTPHFTQQHSHTARYYTLKKYIHLGRAQNPPLIFPTHSYSKPLSCKRNTTLLVNTSIQKHDTLVVVERGREGKK